MSSLVELVWTPTGGYPTTTPTSLKSIATSHIPALTSSAAAALSKMNTAKNAGDVVSYSRIVRGAEASLSIISAQQVLATATDSSVEAKATEVILESMYNLHKLAEDENIYGTYLNRGGNIFFLAMFTILFFFHVYMLFKSRYHWFNIAFFCGYGLQFAGFLGRVLAFTDDTDMDYFLLEFVCLTISPAFIMGGVYFLFGQNIAIYGRKYSIMKPMWYSYFFIACDITSLIVQGVGGGMAAVASSDNTDTAPGTWTMFGGITFQVICMTAFIVMWLEFVNRINFLDRRSITSDSQYMKYNPITATKMLLNLKSARAFKDEHIEQFYDPRFAYMRQKRLVQYYPLAVTCAVAVIYIRCVYRVVELQEGFSGYLIEHEVFLMALDASMIAIAGLIFIPFHPYFVFGKVNVLGVSAVKNGAVADFEEKADGIKLDTVNDQSSSDSVVSGENVEGYDVTEDNVESYDASRSASRSASRLA